MDFLSFSSSEEPKLCDQSSQNGDSSNLKFFWFLLIDGKFQGKAISEKYFKAGDSPYQPTLCGTNNDYEFHNHEKSIFLMVYYWVIGLRCRILLSIYSCHGSRISIWFSIKEYRFKPLVSKFHDSWLNGFDFYSFWRNKANTLQSRAVVKIIRLKD